MIRAIGRYTALLGFTFAALLHLAGYVYLDLPHRASEILTVGIFVLIPVAMRSPIPDRIALTDTLAEKVSKRLFVGGWVVFMLTTLIWIFLRGPEVGAGLHPMRVRTLLPVWRISERHYRMFRQQWGSLSAAVVYLFFWLQFSSKKVPASAADPATSTGSSEGPWQQLPPIIKRLIQGTILACIGLFVVGWILHLVGSMENGAIAMVLAVFGGISVVAALAGIGAVISALRD